MGLKGWQLINFSGVNLSAIDYMLETMYLACCLLFIVYKNPVRILPFGSNLQGTIPIDVSTLLCNNNSENNNNALSTSFVHTISRKRSSGFSETIRQLSNSSVSSNDPSEDFFKRLAGVLDGDGNFDIRNLNGKRVLKAIRIKLHNRDKRILTYIQNQLHFGRINAVRNKPYSLYIVSTYAEMRYLILKLNGFMRLNIKGFKESCDYVNIQFKEADYRIPANDPYFAGLVDTDGSITFNYSGNRIECSLEFKLNEYSKKLCLDSVIPGAKPYILERTYKSGGVKKDSILFKFQNVQSMIPIYDYFMINRLYSDMKFYRVSKIKSFIEIRKYKTPKGSPEHGVYAHFLLDWIKYQNPQWAKVAWVSKILDKNIVHEFK